MHDNCLCVKSGEQYLCPRCGRSFPLTESDIESISGNLNLVYRRCRAPESTPDDEHVENVTRALIASGQDRESLGLGDMTAAALETIGITKERWNNWWGEEGPCRACENRQDRLNAIGKKISGFLGL